MVYTNKLCWDLAKKHDHLFLTMSVERNGRKKNFYLIDELENLFREAWDRCRTMTKEQAMLAYIDEIRKVV